jgi:hypothetical protein
VLAERSDEPFDRRFPSAAALVGRSFLLLLLIMLGAAPTPAEAQRWVCAPAEACGSSATLATSGFAVRLENAPGFPAVNRPVTVATSGGAVTVANKRDDDGRWRTDENGYIIGYVATPTPGQTVTLLGELESGNFLPQTVLVGAHAQAPLRTVEEVAAYAGTQLRDVQVAAAIVDPEQCSSSIVRFSVRPGMGAVSLDSVFGEPDPLLQCVYKTDWRLGDQIGRQTLVARAGSAAPLSVHAIARRRSTIRLGLAMAVRHGGVSALETPAVRRVRVQRDDSTVGIDSILEATYVRETGWEIEPMPLILLDTPLRPGFDRLRLSIGASATNFRRDFYAGIGVGQLKWGSAIEDGFDLQVGTLLSRPLRLANPDQCARDLTGPADVRIVSCRETSDLRWGGLAVTASTHAQSLLAAAGKMLGL